MNQETPVRILVVSNCPVLEHLGSGYVIRNYVFGMRALNNEVDLLQPDNYEILKSIRPRANSYRQSVGMLLALKRALRLRTYDVVEFWGGEAWLASRWLAKHRRNGPMIVQHTNGPEPRYNRIAVDAGISKPSTLQKWHVETMMLNAFAHADGVVTVSEYDRLWLEENHLPQSGRRQAIEVALPDCFNARPVQERRSKLIGFCGTWLRKKGIDVIVSDLTRVLREFPDWRFRVLGSGSVSLVRSSFPEDLHARIDVLPMIKDKKALAQQYDQMEIFVLPSLIESFGIALAEAMACGCAVVATRIGFAASLNPEEALLLDQSRSPQLYEAVKRLILNPDLRSRLANAAWKRVQPLRWPDSIATLSTTYQSWLSEFRRPLA
jgi:glycosyltransferase involved in cell wall biosynthesis